MGNKDPVELALRRHRPEAGEELVAGLTARVSVVQPRAHGGSRFAFAAAMAVFVVGTFLSFGGLAYASSGAATASQQKAASTEPAARTSKSAAADEYGEQAVAEAPLTPPTTPKTTDVAGVAASSPPAKSGTLPFTGVGLGSTLLVSLSLVVFGVYLRRRESRE